MTTLTITIDTDKWAVVPREATDRMRDAVGPEHPHARHIYRAMVAAAPRPVPVQQADAVFANDVLILMDHINDIWDAQNYEDTNADRVAHWNKVANAADAILKAKQQPAPRPAPTSERLPTEADADFQRHVWWLDSINNMWTMWHWDSELRNDLNRFTHWCATGLKRPPAPGEEGC